MKDTGKATRQETDRTWNTRAERSHLLFRRRKRSAAFPADASQLSLNIKGACEKRHSDACSGYFVHIGLQFKQMSFLVIYVAFGTFAPKAT
jgi:hypothetical protein